jgi:hypothetical protein
MAIPIGKSIDLKDRTADAPMPFAVKSPIKDSALRTTVNLSNSASSINDLTD